MAIFAAISSGLSIPLATGLNWGWKLSLIFWTIPAIIGSIIWLILSNRNQKSEQVDVQYITSDNLRIWREPLAWQVALYMGLQSSVFYVSIYWLHEFFHSFGVVLVKTGWLLTYLQLYG